ncbi:hypothetical protein cgp_1036 [Corynebacterium glutamicum MB001]|nr:hypothetical protein cgp_1036 [Corynebacterium glutamicum MB001]ASW13599.1 hypothetical protein cgc1_1036 [Corynebacterium glutamicum]QYO73140.1 hypothetical protein cgisf_1036 [Corynebacterium glutamicum]
MGVVVGVTEVYEVARHGVLVMDGGSLLPYCD